MYFTRKVNGTDTSLQERRQEKYEVNWPWCVILICHVIFRSMRGGEGKDVQYATQVRREKGERDDGGLNRNLHS